MTRELLFLGILTATPAIVLLIHSVLSRLLRSLTPQLVAFLSIGLGFPVTGGLCWVLYLRGITPLSQMLPACLYALVVYTFLSYAYFHLFNMSETARGIRILYELYSGGSMTYNEINKRYMASAMLEVRLKRLAAMGQILNIKDRYYSSGYSLYLASLVLAFWGKIIGFHIDISDTSVKHQKSV
ncbi:hypothetical protein ACFL6Y_08735 [Elusimicrobiota bacterium]